MELHRFADQRAPNRAYVEFLRTRSLSAGVYVLPAGATDHQQPHGEEEVYFVVSGRGRFTAGERDEAVAPGDIIFVEAGEPHRFHTIVETLELLVMFAPAEGTATA